MSFMDKMILVVLLTHAWLDIIKRLSIFANETKEIYSAAVYDTAHVVIIIVWFVCVIAVTATIWSIAKKAVEKL